MQVLSTIFSIIILVMSVVIHEVSHGYVAGLLGDPTARLAGRLTLNPLKHLDPIGSFLVPLITSLAGVTFGWAKPVPYNPYNLQAGRWGPAIVAVAGPAANFLIAIIFGLLVRFGAGTFLSLPFIELAKVVVLVNVVLGTFNMIPIPPLDGSKVLFAFLPYRYNSAVAFLERNQLLLILFIIVFGWRLIVPVVYFLASVIMGGF